MIRIVIPIRLNSNRLQQKVLLPIGTEPLFVYVYNSLKHLVKKNFSNRFDVQVSTPDLELLEWGNKFGINIIYTPNTTCGSHSVLEAVKVLSKQHSNYIDGVVNWQVDYPEIDGEILASFEDYFCCEYGNILTPYYWSQADNFNSNNVKIATNGSDHALYFSRSPIPWDAQQHKIHVGVYGFPPSKWKQVLELYNDGEVSMHNCCESLEQLLWLENGFPIKTFECQFMPSINTKIDYENYLSSRERESSIRKSSR